MPKPQKRERKGKSYEEFEHLAKPYIDKLIQRFGRVRLMFPDYPGGETTWSGIYSDLEMPQMFKESLFGLAMESYKLGFKARGAISLTKKRK